MVKQSLFIDVIIVNLLCFYFLKNIWAQNYTFRRGYNNIQPENVWHKKDGKDWHCWLS